MVYRPLIARTKSIVVSMIACICVTVSARAFEYSSITDSTVIGSNFDCPTGMANHIFDFFGSKQS